MRILVTGAAGMLGRDLAAILSAPGAAHDLTLVDRDEFDITDHGATGRFLRDARPEVVIHGAAYTDVDGSERDPDLAMRINGAGTANVVDAAAGQRARVLYVSTDYVFDGKARTPYAEDHPTSPLNAYGRSKLAGEEAVRKYERGLIVRTEWLYGSHGRHFPGTMIDRANSGLPLRVVDDQFGAPTWTRNLAEAMSQLLAVEATGVVHAASRGCCSWFQFAEVILAEARERGMVDQYSIEPMKSSELDRPALRPAYSVLSDARLRSLGLEPLPHWREAVRRFLDEQRKS